MHDPVTLQRTATLGQLQDASAEIAAELGARGYASAEVAMHVYIGRTPEECSRLPAAVYLSDDADLWIVVPGLAPLGSVPPAERDEASGD